MRSRLTLASIEAAAIDTQVTSPFTIVRVMPPPTKSTEPSSSTRSGTTGSASRARRAARRSAADMPSASHSSCVTTPSDQASHHAAMRSNESSRSRSVSSFESRMRYGRRSFGATAAPITSGPAHAPRPTSSMPTTTASPAAHSSRSVVSVGACRRSDARTDPERVATARPYRRASKPEGDSTPDATVARHRSAGPPIERRGGRRTSYSIQVWVRRIAPAKPAFIGAAGEPSGRVTL